MREAIGHALLLQLVLVFMFAIMLIFVNSVSYSKAYKLKNRIINIIEENKGYNSEAVAEINSVLSDVGYQISRGTVKCQKKRDSGVVVYPSSYSTQGYKYCVTEYSDKEGQKYYGVTTFMNFDFPVIKEARFMEFSVYGETKTIGILD